MQEPHIHLQQKWSVRKLWATGNNQHGALGQNNIVKYSSPVQIPGADMG